tara:strand:+ start:422 stop:574 length:153 start_codon:yes stop_codon:yes gene_type:complete
MLLRLTSTEIASPVFALYLPAPQAVQAELLVLPTLVENLPAPQSVHEEPL